MTRDNRRKLLAVVFVLVGLPVNVIHPAQAQEKLAATALTNGLEGPPSNEVEVVTRPAAACANPGSCPWGN